MTNAARGTMIRLLAFGVLVLAATSWAQKRPPIAEQIAKTYGLDSFGQIDAIRYTFNAEFPGVKRSETWEWEPKTDQVSYEGRDKTGKPVKLTYLRSQLGSQAANVQDEIDPAFVNDQYWLLFPLHVSWDDSANVEDTGMHKLPLGRGSAKRVLVKYPLEGGYTPGDTWELYVGSDNRVREFVYHRGGSKKPSVVVATWAGYKLTFPRWTEPLPGSGAGYRPLGLEGKDFPPSGWGKRPRRSPRGSGSFPGGFRPDGSTRRTHAGRSSTPAAVRSTLRASAWSRVWRP